MQIKKFKASTLKEATQMMKDELGSDAVILGTRIIEGDSELSIKKMFEITAGIEEVFVHQESEVKSSDGNSQKNFYEELQKLEEKINASKSKRSHAQFNSNHKAGKSPITKDISEDKKSINKSVQKELKEIIDLLYNREVQKPIISTILDNLKKYKGLLNSENIDSYVISNIATMIPTYNLELTKNNKSKIIALVGPTGVGKTTCIAKLAVISKILHNLNVGLISIDTYRLGAIDQLKIFADISNIDMEVAYEVKDMPAIINKFKKKDIIFIDTAGRSQKNIEQLRETEEFLKAVNVDETYLVLSSTSTTKNLFDVAENFKLYKYNSVIFTKIDEAVSFGSILNLVSNFDVPISFISNGQVIPDDIISADSDFIANMIYTGKISK
jgi:flagellar biosynthesis protein FlhF